MCPTQRRQVPVIDLSNDAEIANDEEEDAKVADEGSAEVPKKWNQIAIIYAQCVGIQ